MCTKANHITPTLSKEKRSTLNNRTRNADVQLWTKYSAFWNEMSAWEPPLCDAPSLNGSRYRQTGELSLHKALIDLSRNERGVRLITTNFDNRFVEAGLEEELVDAAPKLPVPKPHNWSSLVHLHGRIVPNQDGSNLVLTSADFGRAYLTEQWAARFITELFREFTVVFVGYSVGDPVMSYMVDAIAAERVLGVRFAAAYAFADEDGTDAGRSEGTGWLACQERRADPL